MSAIAKDRVERYAVRVLLLDAAQSVLLLSTRDASNPAFGTSWELPGGGITRGENVAVAAARELREEIGFILPPAHFSMPLWHREVLYTYRGERRQQREVVCVARILELAPSIDDSGREPIEREDHLLYRWWRVNDLRDSEERFYPKSLPRHVDSLIAGFQIEDPLETWDE